MTIVARYATPGRGFDASEKVTRTQSSQLWALGYRWCCRYVPLPGVKSDRDIDAAELDLLVGQGFDVSLVQHTRFPGWLPSMHSGFVDASTAIQFSLKVGFPLSAHIFLDLEGISGGALDASRFAEDWAQAVVDAGYRAGVYCGYGSPLDADDLWLLHNVDCYWSDAGHRIVKNRGVAISQGIEHVVAGLEIDEDTLAPDLLGGMPRVAARDSGMVAA